MHRVEGKYIRDTINAANEMIELLKRIFNYHLLIENSDIDFDSEKYSSITSEALEIITRGEQKLEPHHTVIFNFSSRKSS